MPETQWIEVCYPPLQEEDKEKTLAVTAYEKLIRMVVSLEIRPGALLQERHLAEMLNMSRTPLREALTRLCHEKWITINARRNIVVRPVNATTIREVFEVREMLELGDDATHAAFVNMSLVHDIMTNMHINNFDYILTNQKFHAYLGTIDRNSLICGLWERMNLENVRLAVLALELTPQRREVAHDEHRAILEALLRRDDTVARKNLLAHLRVIRRNLERVLG